MNQHDRVFLIELSEIRRFFDDSFQIKIKFTKHYETLPNDYYFMTNSFLSDKIVDQIKVCLPWFSNEAQLFSDFISINSRHYPNLTMQKMERLKTNLHDHLEKAATDAWLYLGVPSLEKLVRKNLRTDGIYRTYALMNYQAKNGYDATKIFVSQFEEIFTNNN